MEDTNLKHKAAGAAVWNLIERFGIQLVFLITGIILARILNVGDYALVGMLAIFTAISSILTDSGFSVALIREKDVNNIDFSSVFVFNIFISGILYIILFLSAPLIAGFYNQPDLIPLSRVMFLAIPINAFGLIQNVVLSRRVRFKKLAQINLTAMILSGALALTMAFTGKGVWALAAQSVGYAACRTSGLWLTHVWNLSFKFRIERLKKHFYFSVNLLITSLLNAAFINLYSLFIGRYFPKEQMGYYTQGNKFAEIPNGILTGPIQNMSLTVFSKIQDDENRLVRACRKSMRSLSFMIFPVIFGLISIAKPLFLTLLGDKWEGMIFFFQLICIANIFTTFSALNNIFLNIKGHSRTILHLEILKIALLVISLFFSIRYGIIAMLYGLIAVRFLCFIIGAYVSGKKTGYSIWMQLKDLAPYLAISLIMAILVYSWTFIINNHYLLLTLQIITGALFYIIVNEKTGSKVYKDTKEMILKRFLPDK